MARIAFVDTFSGVKIGIFYLSSVLKNLGHNVDIFLEPFEEDFLGNLKEFKPDFVGFSSFLGQEVNVLQLFSNIKESLPEAKTVQGGPSVVIYSNLIYHPSVDFT